MITTEQSLSNVQMIREGTGRIRDEFANLLRGQDGGTVGGDVSQWNCATFLGARSRCDTVPGSTSAACAVPRGVGI